MVRLTVDIIHPLKERTEQTMVRVTAFQEMEWDDVAYLEADVDNPGTFHTTRDIPDYVMEWDDRERRANVEDDDEWL